MAIKNIIDFAYEAYQQSDSKDVSLNLEDFVDFAKQLFIDNPPSSVIYPKAGLGLRLRNGVEVSFVDSQEESYQMRDEGIPITRPMNVPGQHGVTGTGGIPVFGDK